MTKNYKISDELLVGQYHEHQGTLYVAAKANRNTSCIRQCDALRSDRCKGICYRFKNNGFVLKEAHPQEDEITVIETAFGKAAREYQEKRIAGIE